jgi:hypothetical protein
MSLFCTMAFGERFASQARYLIADLGDFGVRILVLTDHPEKFRRFRNAVVRPHYPEKFSYHLKRIAVRETLLLESSATFIDADGVLRTGVPRGIISDALAHRFSPGVHGSKIRTIAEAGDYVFPEVETVARQKGISFDRESITYQEMLFNITAERGQEQRFLEIWDFLAGTPECGKENGAGEGVCIGIAAHGSGMTLHGSSEMDDSLVSKIFWHCALDYRKRMVHRLRNSLLDFLGLAPSADLEKSALYSEQKAR